MQVKCEYCGSYIEDTDLSCPHCGSPNTNIKRVAKETPMTIEELKDWYQKRNLPPYETTRFFIGVNYKGARAFGIYKDGEKFVVYKNKADGSRVIRYEGTDEQYAVNELYLRLKEEILNQKSRQGTNASSGNTGRKRRVSGFRFLSVPFIGLIFLMSIMMTFFSDSREERFRPKMNYYYYHDGDVYYTASSDKSGYEYEWWKYNEDKDTYEYYKDTPSYSRKRKKESFVDGFDKKNSYGSISATLLYDQFKTYDEEKRTAFGEKYDIKKCKEYVNKHHTNPYDNGYYSVGNTLFYYLSDKYSSYNSALEDGWYRYSDNNWEYYSDGSDASVLREELFYDPEDYYVGEDFTTYQSGSIYNFDYNNTWEVNENAFAFEDTPYYADYEAAEDAYYEHVNSSSNNDNSSYSDSYDWGNDSSYDWDSNDSWDSGYSDWDSDW